jgi:hypothetical protein
MPSAKRAGHLKSERQARVSVSESNPRSSVFISGQIFMCRSEAIPLKSMSRRSTLMNENNPGTQGEPQFDLSS